MHFAVEEVDNRETRPGYNSVNRKSFKARRRI